ncbi:tyrosine-protein phosphatase [Mucilaginibacter ginsenosidivorax]|uniref:Tyrosine-protein phosphatase n=1 Tax=Mucilaginibacter ginsenosidivorax TaxID=862126 RepID=A0A5B8WAP2_9SPHI|nr:tyrosine-protein phosphatase [Mucilaginibacter ginsenosidivorax]QEC79852.1 tyrosine-protein phosphatase [Mucilaginibacter ginsenosidivorax]
MKRIILLSFAAVCFTCAATAQVADSAKRKVELKGAVNFRDLGGYATKDGHHVKWGKVYRSADMSKLTDDDLAILNKLNVAYDVDLRGTEESKNAPDRLNPNTDYILCPAGSDNAGNMLQSLKGTTNGDSVMQTYYSNTTYLADRYKPFFGKLLGMPGDKSLVFHCTAGKDRTGIGAALLLYSLGVPYDTIINDYEASNYYRAAENKKMAGQMVKYMHINEGVANDVLAVKKSYLDATFTAIKAQYGSIDNYLKNQIGLTDKDLKTLKKKFLD